MKRLTVFAVLFVAVIYMFSLSNQKTEVYSASSSASKAPPYCLAIRGNGELEPAHWGAMARVVELLGLPRAMAGGSSATISMFLLNAIAQNPAVSDEMIGLDERNRRAALMIKSFLGFFTEIKNTRFSQDLFKFYGEYDQKKATGMTAMMTAELVKNNFGAVLSALKEGIQSGIFEAEALKPLSSALLMGDAKRAQFYMDQLAESVSRFGKFDALNDANLFFRPGLINFANASESFGRWASFYAGANLDQKTKDKWTQFFKTCTTDSDRISWSELVTKTPACSGLFHNVFTDYFAHEPSNHLENASIGKPIAVFPSTAVLTSTAAAQYEKALIDYDKNVDPQFGLKFKLKNPDDVKFGYWGADQDLKKIKAALDITDEKNRRFYALGETTWKEVLSLSPAEPGLARLIPFTAHENRLISAGGWSDLHPVNVLKASGCQDVIYLTREGGESPFAQGVASRLLNNGGDAATDPNSPWSRLFNLSASENSFSVALSQATAVLCTQWNSYDVTKDLQGLIDNAYRSPFAISPDESQNPRLNLSPILKESRLGCQPH